MTRRRQLLCSVRSALSVALSAIAVFLPVGLARAGNGDFAYPFSCSWPSLTADFAGRDQLPESHEPPADWYRTDAQGHYANHGWGPAADALPAPVIPQGAQCNSRTWMQERVLAVAMRYIYAPGNALGLQYRHHHIPGWDPTTSTYAGAPEDNPDPDNPDGPTAWSPGRGLDCSNFTPGSTTTVWESNSAVTSTGRQTERPVPWAGAFPNKVRSNPGDLVYLHPNGDAGRASHVVIYLDDGHILDSRVNAQNRVGVQIRDRVGWYREAVVGAWRPIG